MKKLYASLLALVLMLSNATTLYASADHTFVTTKLRDGPAFAVIYGEKFGFNMADWIHPIYEDEDQIATTKYEPFAKFKSAFAERLTPGHIRQENKMIDWNAGFPILWTSMYCAIMYTDSEHGNPEGPVYVLSEERETSHEIPNARQSYQHGETINSMIGTFSIEPDASGVFNRNKPVKQIAGISVEDCRKHDLNVPWTQLPNDQTHLSRFGEAAQIWGTFFVSLFTTIVDAVTGEETEVPLEEPAKNRVELTQKTTVAWDQENCQDAVQGCSELDLSDETARLINGGWAAGFVDAISAQKPIVPHGGIEYQVRLAAFENAATLLDSDKDFNLSAVSQKMASCMSVPSADKKVDYQAVAKIGGEIEIKSECGEKPVGKCPIDLIEEGLATKSISCNLKNPGAYTSSNTYLTALEKQSLPNGIPPLMRKVLEAAGATYNVPASVLLGTMLEEGSFEHAGTWDWTDDKVREFSDCTRKDPMPSCDAFAHPVTDAKGPFGMIQNWWDNYIQSGGPYKAYENDPNWKEAIETSKPNVTQCNFVDAAFVAARELGEDQSHYQPAYVPPAPLSCTIDGATYNTNIPNIPGSCADWTADRVALARMQYGDRVCANDVGRMVRTFKGI